MLLDSQGKALKTLAYQINKNAMKGVSLNIKWFKYKVGLQAAFYQWNSDYGSKEDF